MLGTDAPAPEQVDLFDDPRNSLRQTIRALINTKFRMQAQERFEEAKQLGGMVTACRQMLVELDNE